MCSLSNTAGVSCLALAAHNSGLQASYGAERFFDQLRQRDAGLADMGLNTPLYGSTWSQPNMVWFSGDMGSTPHSVDTAGLGELQQQLLSVPPTPRILPNPMNGSIGVLSL